MIISKDAKQNVTITQGEEVRTLFPNELTADDAMDAVRELAGRLGTAAYADIKDTLDITEAGSALDASQGPVIVSMMESLSALFDGWKMSRLRIQDSTSYKIDLISPSRGLIIFASYSDTRRGLYGFGVSSGGVVHGSVFGSMGSDITLAPGTGSIDVTVTEGGVIDMFILSNVG